MEELTLKAYSNLSPKKGWSWETRPEPIPDSEVAETLEADVLIIGGGISGLAAGARLTQKGYHVIIVDRYKNLLGRAGHVGVTDSAVMRRLGVTIDKKQFAKDWMRVSGSRVNEELLWMYINRSGEAFDWLMEQGAGDVDATLYTGYYKGPGYCEYPGTHIVYQKKGSERYKASMGGQLVVEMLQKTVLDGGNQIFRPVRAEQLVKDESGRISGCLARDEQSGIVRRYLGKLGVILATGDIEGDPEMLEAFCSTATQPSIARYWPVGNNTGDGHKMAYWEGAAFDDPNWAASLHGRRDEDASYYSLAYLYVNDRGERFMNEDTWTQGKSLALLAQKGEDIAYTIMDADWLENFKPTYDLVGGQAVIPLQIANFGNVWDPVCGMRDEIENMIRKGRCAFRADTLEELAEQMGVPADKLIQTVNRYNELADKGEDTDFGKRPELLFPIRKGPFIALKWGLALLDVFGGALTDTQLHVITPYNRPIPGLYAVGNVAGGFYGVDYPLLMNGNSFGRALTWALVVSESIEADAEQQPRK